MWVSPTHPNPPKQASQPPNPGQVLAGIPRNEGHDELRVTLDTYNGRPFISVRLWERDRSGGWWPTRKCVSVLERMLVERLMVCWVDAHVSDLKAASDGGSLRLKEHFGQAASRANSRLMKAFKTLVQVRRVNLHVLLKVGTEQAAPSAAFSMDDATLLPGSQRIRRTKALRDGQAIEVSPRQLSADSVAGLPLDQ
jgi:hypothetical protein